MLTKDTVLPAVFDSSGSLTTKVVITYKINDNRFAGYTTADSNPLTVENRQRWTGVWDANGKCVYTDATNNIDSARSNRAIKFTPKPEQVQYEKLSIDQRAILQLIWEAPANDGSRTVTYVVDTLKVDVNLAGEIIKYAVKKEFKENSATGSHPRYDCL